MDGKGYGDTDLNWILTRSCRYEEMENETD